MRIASNLYAKTAHTLVDILQKGLALQVKEMLAVLDVEEAAHALYWDPRP